MAWYFDRRPQLCDRQWTPRLFICPEGVSSVGTACGTLSCRLLLNAQSGDATPYTSDIHMFHGVDDVECTSDGKIRLTSLQLVLHKISEVGAVPTALQAISFGSEPWTFKWTLDPDTSGGFKGKVVTSALGGTEGELTASRRRTLQ